MFFTSLTIIISSFDGALAASINPDTPTGLGTVRFELPEPRGGGETVQLDTDTTMKTMKTKLPQQDLRRASTPSFDASIF